MYCNKLAVIATMLFAVAASTGCTALMQYRTNYQPCVSTDPARDCVDRAIQDFNSGDPVSPGYLLGIVEFDDQGQLFDRAQMYAVLNRIDQESANNDVLVVVFVHGFKHSAREGDDKIDHFRQALLRLSQTESALSRAQNVPARRIVGIYLGWRGESVTVPVIENLTFWARKNTAHKIGHGQVTEVLNRIDQIRQVKDAQSPTGHSRSRLIVVGHSFGAALVYSALAQILESRFVQTNGPAGVSAEITGFGNLVVLINPAFEALLYAPLSDMSTERAMYLKGQLPVLAIMTSEADHTTRVTFPIGRWFSTRFEKNRNETRVNPISHRSEIINEHQADISAVGHFIPYRTHFLRADAGSGAGEIKASSADERAQTVMKASQSWEQDAPGSQIEFPGSLLQRTGNSAGRNPYLVIGVDKTLIPDHDSIWDPRIEAFITQLILLSSQSSDLSERRLQRQQAIR